MDDIGDVEEKITKDEEVKEIRLDCSIFYPNERLQCSVDSLK